MDLYANKKIKITKNTLTGEETLILTNKHSVKNNSMLSLKTFSTFTSSSFRAEDKKFYSTNSNSSSEGPLESRCFKKDDKYLSYITPIEPPKSKIAPYLIDQNKKPFSAADIETMDFKGTEVPISISIKTQNKIEIFIIDSNCFNNAGYNLDVGLKEL